MREGAQRIRLSVYCASMKGEASYTNKRVRPRLETLDGKRSRRFSQSNAGARAGVTKFRVLERLLE